MTWTIWDVLVILTVFLQCVALGALVFFVLKIKNGPVASVRRETTSLISRGKVLAASGKSLATRQIPHLQGFSGHIVALREAIHLEMLSGDASGPFSYAKILSAFTTLRTAQRGWAQVQSRRGHKTAPLGPKRIVKPSMAQRLGLVPPAAKHLEKAYGFARLLLQVRRELRQRNIM